MASLINFSRLFKIGARTCTQIIGTELLTKQPFIAQNLCNTQIRNYRKMKGIPRSVPWFPKIPEYQTEVLDTTEADEKLVTEMSKEINRQIAEDKTGRLFAIIHLSGKQFKVTESDILVVKGYWPPNPGDELVLEKVLLVGSSDFTLVGRPILNRQLVTVNAVVIDKTFSSTVTHFRFRKRKQYRRIHFYRHQHTMLRIKSITVNGQIDKKLEVEGLDRVY